MGNVSEHGADVALIVFVLTAPVVLLLMIALLRGYTVELRARFARRRRGETEDV